MQDRFVEPLTDATTATREMKMKTYNFTIIASGIDPNTSDFEDRFFEAGCDDATITFQKGAIILEFDREAKSLGHAIQSAIANVEGAGAHVEHVEPDYLVSLSDIAVRAGVTRAAASMYANGKRGSDFPAPVARVTTESALWDWAEVASWLYRYRRISLRDVVEARIIKRANLSISSREPQRSRPNARRRTAEVHVLHFA